LVLALPVFLAVLVFPDSFAGPGKAAGHANPLSILLFPLTVYNPSESDILLYDDLSCRSTTSLPSKLSSGRALFYVVIKILASDASPMLKSLFILLNFHKYAYIDKGRVITSTPNRI
jgi:hypothetical protein